MDPLDRIDRLAAFARREAPPGVDVGAAVLRRVRAFRERRSPAWPLAVGLSLATAASLLTAVYAWSAVLDPYLQFLAPVGMATP